MLAINQKSGKIKDGSNGDVASDHYHRYKVSVHKDILSSAHVSFLTQHKSLRRGVRRFPPKSKISLKVCTAGGHRNDAFDGPRLLQILIVLVENTSKWALSQNLMSYTSCQCLWTQFPARQHTTNPSLVPAFNLNYMLIPFKYPWSEGRFGGVNPAGIKFYNSLINGLLGKGMHSLFCYYVASYLPPQMPPWKKQASLSFQSLSFGPSTW